MSFLFKCKILWAETHNLAMRYVFIAPTDERVRQDLLAAHCSHSVQTLFDIQRPQPE